MSGKQWDIVAGGYASMDHILKIRSPARVGFSSLISNKNNAMIYYGGCPVNISYALCRLSIRAIPLLRVGVDYEKTGFRDFLEQGGVPTGGISRVEGEITPVCYLVQDNEGQHITLFYPGAMDGKYSKPVDDSFFDGAGMGLLTVGAYEDNREFLKQAQKHRLPLAFGMKSDHHAFPPDFLKEALCYSSIIFTNEEERRDIEKTLRLELTDLLESGRADILVTTLGKCGSRYYYKEGERLESGEVPICDRGPPVETAGSGDAYMAGFLYGLHRGRTVRECAMLGTVLASFVIEKEGCCTGLPREEALLRRYGEFENEIGIGKGR
jgi:adenosine kinase